MVDKPILKKDRPPEAKDSKPSLDKEKPKARAKGKGKGKGKGRRDERDKKPPVNPALMRGPKPTKKVEPEPEPEISEDAGTSARDEAPADEAPADETTAEAEVPAAE